jgi:hypothetical protein
MQFFLPESDDLVDRHFDFLADRYGCGKSTRHDVYAHQLLGGLPCDGVLVSRSTVDEKKLAEIANVGGIHQFLSIPISIPVISDSGAFQYVGLERPPYSPVDTCEFYAKIGVNYGVTLDHVIVEFDPDFDSESALLAREVPVEARRRMDITISGAEEMWAIHQRGGYRYELIGAAQGWSPKSYRSCVERLAAIGYRYIAIGGLARASDKDIRLVLAELVRGGLHRIAQFHLFGVARLSLMDDYLAAGVVSCDSASTIFQAFKSDKENYHSPAKNYTAVRIPSTAGGQHRSPKVRKILKPWLENGDEDDAEKELKRIAAQKVLERLSRLEQEALARVRSYARREIDLTEAMKALVAYDDEFGESRKAYRDFEETLRDRPWESCPCAICREIGVEVVILRGNDRNRRRGFHNTWVFYEAFKQKRFELQRKG